MCVATGEKTYKTLMESDDVNDIVFIYNLCFL